MDRTNMRRCLTLALAIAMCASVPGRASADPGPDETLPSTACANSTQFSSYSCSRTLDDVFNDYGMILVSPGWMTINLGTPKPVNRLHLAAWTAVPTRFPRTFKLLGSNTGAFAGEEVVLFSRENELAWTTSTRTYRFPNTAAYQHYKLDVTANQGDFWLEITEVELRYDASGEGLFPTGSGAVDVDENGVDDSTLTAGPCTYHSLYTCLKLSSTLIPSQELQITDWPVSVQEVGLMGKHFGGGYSAAYVYTPICANLSCTTQAAALYVYNLNSSALVGWLTAPSPAYSIHNAYFGLVRGPNGLRYPFLAPGGKYVGAGDWQGLCLFDAAKISAPDPACYTGFKSYALTFPAGSYRHNGGWLSDVDRDGWDDINLPFLKTVLTISGRTGQQLASSTFNVSAQSEPATASAWFHSGRNYSGFASFNSPSSSDRRVLISSGNAVGTFDDSNCNVSRFMSVAKWNPDSTLSLLWSNFISFSKTIFNSASWSMSNYVRWGDGIDKCVHRTSDSLFWAGANPVVLYSYFTLVDPIPDDCQDEVFDEQENLYVDPLLIQETYQCQDANFLPAVGRWTIQAFQGDTGGGVTAWPQAYLWGRVQHFVPNEPYTLVIETFTTNSGKVRFDQNGHTTVDALWFSKMESNYTWSHAGALSGGARPRTTVNFWYYGSQPIGGGSSWGGLPELVVRDIDSDGLNDVQLTDNSWVGYHNGAIVRK